MQRKSSTKPQKAELMPFQMKTGLTPADTFKLSFSLNSIEAAKAALPIFGGTGPTGEAKPEEKKDEDKDKDKNKPDEGSGDEGNQITPEQFAQITQQVAQLTSKNQELTTQLSTFTAKEDEQRRASMGREESLTEDLTKAQQTIDQMDQIIKRLAVVNAIQGNSSVQFHDVNDAIMHLDHSAYDLDVDLESGTAKVNGIENELSRIAKEKEYLVKKPTLDDENNGTRKPRPTGAPPGPRPVNPTAAARRKELEAKWPVIAAGHAALG